MKNNLAASRVNKYLIFITAVTAFIVVLLTANRLTVRAEDTSMNIYGIYLGDYGGDSTLVESRGEYLLMDLGSVNSYELIQSFLYNRGITSETPISLYYSHLHSDHTGGFANGNGLDRFLTEFNVQKLYVEKKNILVDINDTYETRYNQIETLCGSHGTEVVYLKAGDTFAFGDVNVEILGPVGFTNIRNADYDGSEEESSSGDESSGLHNGYINDLSLTARLTCGNTVFLTTGDATETQEHLLCLKYKEGLKADIYKLGHHGNQSSSTEEFLSYVQPRYSFGLNSGKTQYFSNDAAGLIYRKTYRARLHAARYGVVYMVGDEARAVCYSVVNDTIRMYTEEDGFTTPLTGLLKLKGGIPHPADPTGAESDTYDYSYYYLDENGNTLTGILNIDEKLYLFADGGCRESGHYNSETGVYDPVLEYAEDHSDRRVFAESDASMITGWFTDPSTGAVQYYDAATGIMVRGVTVIDGKEYLISDAGTLQTRTWKQFDEGNWKYYGKYGTMVTGWLGWNGYKYYLDPSTGYRVSGVTQIGSKYYLFSGGGKLQTRVWKKDETGKRYYGKYGSMVTGWLTYNNERYYLDKSTGYMVTGIQKIGSKTYLFSGGGKLQKKVWKYDGTGYRYFGKYGSMVTGWLTYNGNKYYLDPSTGYRVTGTVKIDGKKYTFSKTGILKS